MWPLPTGRLFAISRSLLAGRCRSTKLASCRQLSKIDALREIGAPVLSRDFRQFEWDARLEEDCRRLMRLAVLEDLDRVHDWTTVALVASAARAEAVIRARREGVVA